MKKFIDSEINYKLQYDIENGKLQDIYNKMQIIQKDFFRNEKANKELYSSIFNLLVKSVKNNIEYQQKILRGE